MHATTEQLLSLRDGEPVVAGVQSHLGDCDRCRRELARLSRVRDALRRLPPVGPPGDLWQTVAIHSLERPTGPRFPWPHGIAIAASFVFALVVVARFGQDRDPAADAGAPAASVAEVVPGPTGLSLGELQRRSRGLEALRRAMPPRPEVVRAGTAGTIADLEDRIAWVDLRLNAARDLGLSPAQREALWRERVNLMQSLVQVEYAQVQRPRY